MIPVMCMAEKKTDVAADNDPYDYSTVLAGLLTRNDLTQGMTRSCVLQADPIIVIDPVLLNDLLASDNIMTIYDYYVPMVWPMTSIDRSLLLCIVMAILFIINVCIDYTCIIIVWPYSNDYCSIVYWYNDV